MADELSNDVFISYRRNTSQYMARALWQNLTASGIDVFYDIEEMRAGYFDEILLTQISARPYMIPILAPGALNRCVDEGDWFRREIEAALAHQRVLVPVHTPEFDFSDIERYLPADVATRLDRYQMLEIPPKYFKYAMQRLAEELLVPIDRAMTTPPSAAAAAAAQRQAEDVQKQTPVTTAVLTAEQHFAIAYDASQRGDLRRAADAYAEVIDMNPESAAAFNNRSEVRRRLGDLRGALADANEAVYLKPESAAAVDTRGEVRETLGDLEGALADYEHALELKANYEPAALHRDRVRRRLGIYDD